MSHLSVRLSGSFGELNITGEVIGLSFRSEGVGGFTSASFQLARPIDAVAPEVASLNKVYVYDARSPRLIAWQGYLEDPARSANSQGLVWSINAVGPSARLKDVAVPMTYVDTKVGNWRRGEATAADGPDTKELLHTQSDHPIGFDDPGWRLRCESGHTVSIGDVGAIVYELSPASGQNIARLNVNAVMGLTSVGWQFSVGATGGVNGYNTDLAANFSTTAANYPAVIVTHFETDRNMLWLLISRSVSAVAVSDDTIWVFLYNITVRGTLFNKTGTELLAAADYPVDYVFAHQVVDDILGRWMSSYDRDTAKVDGTTYHITQLAYNNPVRPAEILTDILTFEPEYRWAVWGDTQNGKNEFEWVKWDTGDVLEYDPADGFASPESVSDMYSDVTVRYDDGTGKIHNYTASQTVPELQGIKRTGVIDLGSERGVKETQAAQAASAFLAEHNTPSNAGVLTVARPILNVTKGIMIDPWLIRPGTLLRLKGVQARPDYLNAIDHNGVTLFRVVATEYSTGTNTATLELENFNPTLSRQLAYIQRASEARKKSSSFGWTW